MHLQALPGTPKHLALPGALPPQRQTEIAIWQQRSRASPPAEHIIIAAVDVDGMKQRFILHGRVGANRGMKSLTEIERA